MPLPGGATDKFGNRFEGLWTVRCMIDVLRGHYESIRLEPPGKDGDGVEFWLKKDSSLAYHQVKRQNSPNGNWTLSDLASMGILDTFSEKLKDPLSTCVFVSANSAFQLDELSDRSRPAKSFHEYKQDFLKAKSAQGWLKDICEKWNNCSEETAYAYLKRIEIQTIGERTLRDDVENWLGFMLTNNPANAADVLAQFALDKVHHELKAEDIWEHLRLREFEQKETESAYPINVDFGYPAPQFFVGMRETLQELNEIVSSNSMVIIGGIPGAGKTHLISQYIQNELKNSDLIWIDCESYERLDLVLIRLADFFQNKYLNNSLLDALRNPIISSDRQTEVAAKLCENHECILVFDNYKSERNQSLFGFLNKINAIFRKARVFITTQTTPNLVSWANPVGKIILPHLKEDESLALMRYYLIKHRLEDYPDEVLVQAFKRVGGHPYFLKLLIGLSVDFPLPDILHDLPQIQQEIYDYLQRKIFDQLDSTAKNLIGLLSIFRTPFRVKQLFEVYKEIPVFSHAFQNLLSRFLVTRQTKIFDLYEIHSLVREYAIKTLDKDSLFLAHRLAADYYEILEPKTYGYAGELVYHLIEADLLDRALLAADNLLSHGLYDGLFGLVLEFSSQLIDDHRTKNWAKVYFLRARALRVKDRIADALDCYEMAAKLADDLQLSESAELEMASMLIKLSGRDGYPNAEKQALTLLEKLTQSKNIETKVSALTTQGFMGVRTDKNKAISKLNYALGLAENAQLTRHMMQIYHGLGSAYLDSNSSKALYYFEKSLSVRDQTRSTYGSLDLEADYFAYEAISIIYRSRKKYNKSAQASKECVAIDRNLGLLDKLAHSLYELGMDLCFLKDYQEARKVLEEGLSLIRKNHFGHKAEIATLEWYIKALWYTQDFERSIEHLLEYMVLLQNVHGSSMPHLILRKRDMPPRERGFDYKEEKGNGIHILVLPNEFDFPDVDGWFQKVIDRRPDLSSIKPVFFRK